MKFYNSALAIVITVSTLCSTIIANANSSNVDTVTANPVLTRSATISPDAIIKAKLQTAYSLNPELHSFNINVDVQQGVVNLSGTLQNSIQKDLATTIAKDMDEVTSVIDNINIDPNTKAGENPTDFGQKVIDATITAMIKSKLILNHKVHALAIQVNTVNNIVTLTGTVNSLQEKAIAGRLAIETAGVSTVKNDLITKQNKHD